MIQSPRLYKEEIYSDNRGEIAHFNELDLSYIKRVYFITHSDLETIRAWQGHPNEIKIFKIIKGAFIVAYLKIDDFKSPSEKHRADYLILQQNRNEYFEIPAGYANGLMALEKNSIIQVYSDLNLEDSLKDKIRFNSDYWFNWKEVQDKILNNYA